MKLGEIIKTNNWLSIELTLLDLYPDQAESIDEYRKVFSLLQEMAPQKSAIEIVIEQEIDEETQELGLGNVYGIDHELKDENTNSVALEFTSWDKWIGMKISELTLKEFNELEIISHCLYEMTFIAFDEKEIQEEFSKIKNMVEEIKSLSPEEISQKTISLEDFLKDLDKDD
ncbi:DUF6557 family protein [Aquiflexum sp.]|uniref:DUF6557 family protein n=1 Tax=Aquiflexum sp. TaxID=1872584 RepID=UPI0035948604